MKISSATILFLSICFGSAFAQPITFNLKGIGDSLINRNYALRLVKMQEQIADVQNSFGAAGELPTVGLMGSGQTSSVNTRQEFFNGDVREADGAINQSRNMGVRLDWNLFNGFMVFSTRNELDLRQQQAELNTLMAIENELLMASSLYYEILARESMMKVLDSSLQYSLLRMELARKQWEIGRSKRLDYQQSIIDLNSDSARWLQEKTILKNLYSELNQLMGNTPNLAIQLEGDLSSFGPIEYGQVLNAALTQNTTLQYQKLEERVAWNQIKMKQSMRYPKLGLFGEYNFLTSTNAVGILKSNQTLGPAVGLSISYNLFDGMRVNREVNIAKIQREIATLGVEKIRFDLEHTLLRTFEEYQLQRQLVAFELLGVEIARENLKLAETQLKAGAIDVFQFREIQMASLQSETRYVQAQLSMLQSELQIRQLSGKMLDFVLGSANKG